MSTDYSKTFSPFFSMSIRGFVCIYMPTSLTQIHAVMVTMVIAKLPAL